MSAVSVIHVSAKAQQRCTTEDRPINRAVSCVVLYLTLT